MASSLHQRLKFTVNERLITLRSEEMLFVNRNVSVSYVKGKENKDEDLHVFEVVNTEIVPKKHIY